MLPDSTPIGISRPTRSHDYLRRRCTLVLFPSSPPAILIDAAPPSAATTQWNN